MGLFHFARKKRVSAQGFAAKSDMTPLDLQAFILEPILTPSGLVDAPEHTPNMMAWVDHPGTDWHLASSDLTALPDSSHADPTLAHSATAGATAHAATPGDHDLAMSGSGYGSAQTDATDHSSTGGGYGNAGTSATTPQLGDAHANTPVSTTPTAPTATTPTVLPAVDHPLASPASASVVGSEVTPPLVTPAAIQPLVGIIDTGFAAQNAHLDYSHITLGHDYVDGDNNPLLQLGRGNDHGTGILGLIEATQNHGVEGLHETTPIWLGRATGSGHWADSLVEFVNHAKATGNDHAVVNFSFDLTQTNPDGSVSTRFAFTPQELAALHYAHANHVLIVTAAGNQDGAMSALGQASQQFDNIITVGAADGLERAGYSSYGAGLDLLANGGTPEHPLLTTMGDGIGAVAGSSAAAAQVTGAVSLVWQANPALSYRQVIDLLEHSAMDVGTAGWDAETGFGVINLAAAIDLAKQTKPDVVAASADMAAATVNLIPIPWATSDDLTTSERPTDDWSEPLPDTTAEDGGAADGTDAPPTPPITPPEEADTTGDDSAQTDATPPDGTAAGQDAADQAIDEATESDTSGDETESDAAGDDPTDETDGDSTESAANGNEAASSEETGAVPSSDSEDGYTDWEMPMGDGSDGSGTGDSSDGSGTGDSTPPQITVALVQTGEADTNTISPVTSNPTIAGKITDGSRIATIRAGFEQTPEAEFVDVTTALDWAGNFTLDEHQLAALAGGTLPIGAHTLSLQATDVYGNQASIAIPFTFVPPTLSAPYDLSVFHYSGGHLSEDGEYIPPSASDPTNSSTALIQGKAAPGVLIGRLLPPTLRPVLITSVPWQPMWQEIGVFLIRLS